jgi:hypothetical protein
MADFTTPAPVEPVKGGDYLHDHSRIPAAPKRSVGQVLYQFSGLIAGVLFVLLGAALVFELRDAWESHRDWVPPAGITLAVVGGVSLGHLLVRGRVNAVALPVGLIFISVMCVALDLWIHEEYPDKDGLRLAFVITSAITGGIAAIWLFFAAIFVEATDPTHAPEPEM